MFAERRLSMRRVYLCLLLLLSSGLAGQAQSGTGVSGAVTDTTNAVVVGAEVTATNLVSGEAAHTVTDASGDYQLAGLKPGRYSVVATKPGFQTVTLAGVTVVSGQMAVASVSLPVSWEATTVNVRADLPGATGQPTQQEVFTSDQQLRVLDRQQIATAGPVAGSAQIIALTPGANVTGYGNTGATKYTVGVNGVSQGWGGYGGYSGGGALAITFDGVPVVRNHR